MTFKQIELKKEMIESIEKAKHEKSEILVSFVEKITDVDPLLFFVNNKHLFSKNSFFWKEKDGNLILLGLGQSKMVRLREKKDRFREVKEIWDEIRKKALVYNPYEHVVGVGPLLFGGFSFQPLKSQKPWGQFQDAFFYLPQFMLTIVNGETYLTRNYVLGPNSDRLEIDQFIQEWDLQTSFKPDVDNFTRNDFSQLIQFEIQAEKWKENVGKAIKLLQENYIQKVVLAREMKLICDDKIDTLNVLTNLLQEQPLNYIFFLENEEQCFIGATPERLVKKNQDHIFSACVAGSAPRGKNKEEDEKISSELLNDKKNLEEHQFVVDMIKNSISNYCRELYIPKQPMIMNNADIKHLFTPIEGRLNQEHSLFDVVRSLHPTPALGGTPRDLALSVIEQLEFFERGFYASPIGWVDYKENGEFVVGIRSGLIHRNEALLFAGCGIVKDSDIEKEYNETKVKFRPMLRALGGKFND